MTSVAEFDRHLREVRTLLKPGTAIPAWRLAYLLARTVPPDPMVDSPIYFPIPERPTLVVTMLRWIGERATKDAVSEHDTWLQQIGHIDYFVKSELAMAMLDEASRQNDPWMAAPFIRVLDAAVLLHGDQPQPGIDHIGQLALERRTTAMIVAQETGADIPFKKVPIYDRKYWISAAQFQDLMKRFGPGSVAKPRQKEPLGQRQTRVILEAITKCGYVKTAIPGSKRGKHGARVQIKGVAFQIDRSAFGPDRASWTEEDTKSANKAFNNRWDEMRGAKRKPAIITVLQPA